MNDFTGISRLITDIVEPFRDTSGPINVSNASQSLILHNMNVYDLGIPPIPIGVRAQVRQTNMDT